MRRALCVGINEYPNAPLQGCVNDADDWAGALSMRNTHTLTLLNRDATKERITSELRRLVAGSRWGDTIVFTYSGHGTWVPDRSGDEPDRRDEALCAIDYEDGGIILDDELQAIFSARKFGVRVVVISDSCHSGTVSRFADVTNRFQPRFVSPFTFLDGADLERAQRAQRSTPVTQPRGGTGTILLAGCDDLEFSYDAWIRGRFNGAFTRTAIDYLPPVGVTFASWMKSVRAHLPSEEYPQTPQLFAATWQKYLLF